MFGRRAASAAIALMTLISAGYVLIGLTQNASAQLLSHDPILITKNGDFKPNNGVTGGAGAASNPWIIDGWEIYGTTTENCIEIRGTTEYFTIRNCSMALSDGVVLLGAPHGVVTNVTTYACRNSVRIENCTDVAVSHCSFGSSDYGVCVKNSTWVGVADSGIGAGTPFLLETSADIDFTGNSLSAGNTGIRAITSARLNFSDNRASFSTFEGAVFESISHSNISRNNISLYASDEGFKLTDCDNCTLFGNDIGTQDTPTWIEGIGVEVYGSDNITVESNHVKGRVVGIVVGGSVGSLVFDNDIQYSMSIGIHESNSSSSVIANNTIIPWIGLVTPYRGIFSADSVNCTVIWNNVSARAMGISMARSELALILNNTVDLNVPFAEWPLSAINLLSCNDSLIMNNSRLHPGTIVLDDCINTTVAGNNLSDDPYLFVDNCVGTIIAENNITTDSETAVQVEDSTGTYIAWNGFEARTWCVRMLRCEEGNVFLNDFVAKNSTTTYGVSVEDSSDSAVWGNMFYDSYESAISLYSSTNVSVFWNEVFEGGIRLLDARENLIMNNTLWGWSSVDAMYNCSFSMIVGNIFPDQGLVSLQDAVGLIISENIFGHGGVTIYGSGMPQYDYHLITPDNIVNGEPIIQVTDSMDVDISGIDVGELIVTNCAEVNITDLTIDGVNTGMIIAYCLNVSIQDNTISDNWIGLKIVVSDGVQVDHNWFTNNSQNVWLEFANAKFNMTYPGGGNHWSDYAGVDLLHGPNQDIPGPDGYGDTAYNWFDIVVDHYPILGAFIDYAPVAVVVYDPSFGDITTTYTFDASQSHDDEGSDLQARWDWDGDGTWDTDWSYNLTVEHSFTTPGTYNVTLEVKDSAGNTNITMTQVVVVEEIPEFGAMPLVVMVLLVAIVLTREARRRKAQ